MKRKGALALALVLLVSMVPMIPAVGQGAPADQAADQAFMRTERTMAFGGESPALRDLPTLDVGRDPAFEGVRDRSLQHYADPNVGGPNAGSPAPDAVAQTTPGPLAAATNGLSFAGVGQGDYGHTDCCAPPDTVGAPGATQYVQWVNLKYAVFNKSTGALIAGPTNGSAIWAGSGLTGCDTNNDGDPIVQYDQLAGRWLLTQFSVSTTPYRQCIAVSTTSDATGSYYRYSVSYTDFNDYPKAGVWPDGYYITYNMFKNGATFSGPRTCAWERAQMLVGGAAREVCFQLTTTYNSLLPADLEGTTLPPAGSPNFQLSRGGSGVLNFWRFHVDWTTPANSTLTGPSTIAVSAFTAGSNAPQSGTTNKLDCLCDRLMYRLAYRKFSDHEAMVVNHTVLSNSVDGVRWYELRNASGSTMAASLPVVFQQGTYQPDTNWRWMASIGIDKVGDIAMGYSRSSSSTFPSIYYTGRAPGDAAGTMQTENLIKAGGGSQTGTLTRWGDYSDIELDPADDCTFWYTTEYLKASGTFNWSTWIHSFKMNGCV